MAQSRRNSSGTRTGPKPIRRQVGRARGSCRGARQDDGEEADDRYATRSWPTPCCHSPRHRSGRRPIPNAAAVGGGNGTSALRRSLHIWPRTPSAHACASRPWLPPHPGSKPAAKAKPSRPATCGPGFPTHLVAVADADTRAIKPVPVVSRFRIPFRNANLGGDQSRDGQCGSGRYRQAKSRWQIEPPPKDPAGDLRDAVPVSDELADRVAARPRKSPNLAHRVARRGSLAFRWRGAFAIYWFGFDKPTKSTNPDGTDPRTLYLTKSGAGTLCISPHLWNAEGLPPRATRSSRTMWEEYGAATQTRGPGPHFRGGQASRLEGPGPHQGAARSGVAGDFQCRGGSNFRNHIRCRRPGGERDSTTWRLSRPNSRRRRSSRCPRHFAGPRGLCW